MRSGYHVTVFCGSNFGNRPNYAEEARHIGRGIGENGWTLVYGAGYVGNMGVVYEATRTLGGSVIGVTTSEIRDSEPPMAEDDHFVVITERDMMTRKKAMIMAADAIIVLPGGLGTLDELTEGLTLWQLKYIRTPVLLVNHDIGNGTRYFDNLIAQIDLAKREGFISRPFEWTIVPTADAAISFLKGLWTRSAANVVRLRA